MNHEFNQKNYFSFDLESMTWTVLKPMNEARWDASAIALNGYIYLVGGMAGDKFVHVPELYDPKYDTWHRLARVNTWLHDVTLFTSYSFLYARGACRLMRKYDVLNNCWTQVCN